MSTVDMDRLQEPFGEDKIKWRVRKSGVKKDGNPWARIVPYPDARALMDRLDEACGPENWRTDFLGGPQGGVICSLAIRCDDGWIAKEDGASNTDIESVKGGLTDAFKRACVMWNVGGIRRLYRIGDKWAVFHDDGQYEDKIEDRDGNTGYYKWDPPGIEMGNGEPPEPDSDLEDALAGLSSLLDEIEGTGETTYPAKVEKRIKERRESGELTKDTVDAAYAHAEKKLESIRANGGAPEAEESGEDGASSDVPGEPAAKAEVRKRLKQKVGEAWKGQLSEFGFQMEGFSANTDEWSEQEWAEVLEGLERHGMAYIQAPDEVLSGEQEQVGA